MIWFLVLCWTPCVCIMGAWILQNVNIVHSAICATNLGISIDRSWQIVAYLYIPIKLQSMSTLSTSTHSPRFGNISSFEEMSPTQHQHNGISKTHHQAKHRANPIMLRKPEKLRGCCDRDRNTCGLCDYVTFRPYNLNKLYHVVAFWPLTTKRGVQYFWVRQSILQGSQVWKRKMVGCSRKCRLQAVLQIMICRLNQFTVLLSRGFCINIFIPTILQKCVLK